MDVLNQAPVELGAEHADGGSARQRLTGQEEASVATRVVAHDEARVFESREMVDGRAPSDREALADVGDPQAWRGAQEVHDPRPQAAVQEFLAAEAGKEGEDGEAREQGGGDGPSGRRGSDEQHGQRREAHRGEGRRDEDVAGPDANQHNRRPWPGGGIYLGGAGRVGFGERGRPACAGPRVRRTVPAAGRNGRGARGRQTPLPRSFNGFDAHRGIMSRPGGGRVPAPVIGVAGRCTNDEEKAYVRQAVFLLRYRIRFGSPGADAPKFLPADLD